MSVGTALTTNANFRELTGAQRIPFLAAAASQYYKGQFLMVNASGLVVPVPVNDGATDNSAKRIVGQCDSQPGASGIAIASDSVSVRTLAVVECNALAAATFVQADAGTLVYATDDNQITKTAALNPKVGIFLGFSVTGKPLVAIGLTIPA